MKDKNKLTVFDTPNKELIRVTSDTTDDIDGSVKTIELDLKKLKVILDRNDEEAYKRVATTLLFEVLTVGDDKRFNELTREEHMKKKAISRAIL